MGLCASRVDGKIALAREEQSASGASSKIALAREERLFQTPPPPPPPAHSPNLEIPSRSNFTLGMQSHDDDIKQVQIFITTIPLIPVSILANLHPLPPPPPPPSLISENKHNFGNITDQKSTDHRELKLDHEIFQISTKINKEYNRNDDDDDGGDDDDDDAGGGEGDVGLTGYGIYFKPNESSLDFMMRETQWVPESSVSPMDLVLERGLAPADGQWVCFVGAIDSEPLKKHLVFPKLPEHTKIFTIKNSFEHDFSEWHTCVKNFNLGCCCFAESLSKSDVETVLTSIHPFIKKGTILAFERLQDHPHHYEPLIQFIHPNNSHHTLKFEWLTKKHSQFTLRCLQ